MSRAAHDPSARRPRGPEDVWVEGPSGPLWGRYGAAGLLLLRPGLGVLLQLRAVWSHHGGTWGIPGGARKADETAEQAAVREADEEAGVPPSVVAVAGEHVVRLGDWSYTTVIAMAAEEFTPFIGDAESVELRWVPVPDVTGLPLHPGFAAAWPELIERLPG